MKTMNYLSLIALCLITVSCDKYNPFDKNGPSDMETFYWEIDFHQQALSAEDFQLRQELREIEEQQENGNNENQARMDEIFSRLGEIEEDLAQNIERVEPFRGIPGGGLPPRCDPREFRPCPMPRGAVSNLYISAAQFESEKSGFTFLDINGEEVGEMVDKVEVQDTDGQFVKAVMEYDVERAVSVRVSKLNARNEIRTSEYLLE